MISCFGSRDYIVESDYSYAGDFKRYKTFSFIHQQRFDLDSLIPEDIIMKTIICLADHSLWDIMGLVFISTPKPPMIFLSPAGIQHTLPLCIFRFR